jgi:hypothetical protein
MLGAEGANIADMSQGKRPDQPTARVTVVMPVEMRDWLKGSGRSISEAAVAAIDAGRREGPRALVTRDAAVGPRRYDHPIAGTRSTTPDVTDRRRRGTPRAEVPANSCPHPISRRLGDQCAAWGATVKGPAR